MTFEKAKELNLDVYTMPLRMRPLFVEQMIAVGRECIEFEEIVAGFSLFAVAVSPRNREVERKQTREALAKHPREVINLVEAEFVPLEVMKTAVQTERNRDV